VADDANNNVILDVEIPKQPSDGNTARSNDDDLTKLSNLLDQMNEIAKAAEATVRAEP
jgi:hypothetical protein